MRAVFMFIIVTAISSFSQTTFPPLTQIPGVNDTDVAQIIVIGDYDGNGTNDVLIEFQTALSQPAYYNYGIAIYSYSKNEYLFQLPISSHFPYVNYGDLNNDKKVEIILNYKIYAYNSSLVKKKT